MRALVECFRDWLVANRTDASAYELLVALTGETLKVIDSNDPAQREFDSLDLVGAAFPSNSLVDFDTAKKQIEQANLPKFIEARASDLEEFFRKRGHMQGIHPRKRSPGGRHRAQWYLQAYDLPDASDAIDPSGSEATPSDCVVYDYTPPGSVKPAWWARPLIGSGSVVTKSPRGMLWAVALAVCMLELMACLVFLWANTQLARPIQTRDLAGMLGVAACAWMVWRFQLGPLARLADDRLIPAGEFWMAFRETSAQLELAKEGERRVVRLVRYSAVCPVCAGTVELRYSTGPNPWRVIGCCNEAPHDHAFSFDRITRRGRRI